MESVQQCHKIRQKQSSGSQLPLSPALTPGQAGNTRATCRGIVDKATASPSAHKRMTGKYETDVFGGSGFLTKATNHVGLRGFVLDTTFGPRYDVTQLLVLTRIRQDVSAGTCVAGMISPPRQRASCSPKVITACAVIANLLHLACRAFCFMDRAEIQTLEAQPRTAWSWRIFALLVRSTESGHCFWLERGQQRCALYCSQVCWDMWTLQCFRTKTCSSKGLRITQCTWPRPLRLSVALAMILTMTQCALQWLAQLAIAYLTLALIARTDLLTYATLATHDSHSL